MSKISAKTGKSLEPLRGQMVALMSNELGVVENHVQETYTFKGKEKGKVLVTVIDKDTLERKGRKIIADPDNLTVIGMID